MTADLICLWMPASLGREEQEIPVMTHVATLLGQVMTSEVSDAPKVDDGIHIDPDFYKMFFEELATVPAFPTKATWTLAALKTIFNAGIAIGAARQHAAEQAAG